MIIKKEGKKVFLLYPHGVIKDELLNILVEAGFETYIVNDHARALKLLAVFPDAIMFINVDEGLSEQEWKAYIKGITATEQTKNCRLGILSHSTDQNTIKGYMSELTLLCGCVQLKLGFDASVKTILAALDANGAKGRRKFIRAACGGDPTATVNVKGAKGLYYGRILDISAVGIAARFEKFDDLPTNAKVKEMQLNIRGGRILTDAVFVGKRSEEVYIFLFDMHRMNPDHKILIHQFIKTTLQKFIDNLLI